MKLAIETERESDGRRLAEIPGLPGTMAYGQTRGEAITRVEAMALRVMADRLEHGEPTASLPPQSRPSLRADED